MRDQTCSETLLASRGAGPGEAGSGEASELPVARVSIPGASRWEPRVSQGHV